MQQKIQKKNLNLFSKVFLLQVFVLLTSVLIISLTARYFFKRQFLSQVESQLHDSLKTLSTQVNDKLREPNLCSELSKNTQYRFTIIEKSGKVLCDSHAKASEMQNHSDRPEVIDCIASGFGKSYRKSNSIHEESIYGALYIPNKEIILRAGISIHNLSDLLRFFDVAITIIGLILAFVLSIFAIGSTKRVLKPITQLETSLFSLQQDYDEQEENLFTKSEEQATIMSSISDAIIAIDTNGFPLFYNSKLVFLLDSPFSINRQHFSRIFRNTEINKIFNDVLATGKAHLSNTISLDSVQITSAKLNLYYSLSVTPLLKKDGSIYGAVGIFHDVTDLKNAEKIRINFVANVSHELRTPLTSIKGFTDTMLSDLNELRPITGEHLKIIKRNTERLILLIEDLLNLSKLESGEQLKTQEVDTKQITEQIFDQIKSAYSNRNQTIKFSFESSTVFADQNKLEQILINLLDNANKYSPENSEIRLRWYREKNGIYLKITNTGPGVDLIHQPHLFERFYRIEKSRSRDLGGTGLGLAIVKHIMLNHKGNVWCESTPNVETSFYCMFPFKNG